jgi:hypothetical protein
MSSIPLIIRHLDVDTTLAELVDWAESMMMEADFEDQDFETLRDIISRLGLADVKAFGMTWEDSESFLSRLGYHTHIIVTENSGMVEAES